jgi:DNA-binding transcriptional LysR family regulator
MLNGIDLSRTDLNLLVLFEVVLEERHVGRAAERMHLTASAVSHGLGRLRKLLNDPLFLRTPKGVIPTARATELAAPIADLLARARTIVATAEPFDPARSRRRFTVGAPDGIAAVLLSPLLAHVSRRAPGVDLAVRQLLPAQGETSPERAWRFVWSELETRALDVAIIPSARILPRFHKRTLYAEDFVIAMRARHPHAAALTLERYCEAQHLVVSLSGDPHGFVDEALARQGRSRRVALTVPNFMFALAVVAETDLITALPRRFAEMHARRFGVVVSEAPLPLGSFQLHAVTPKAALMDRGVAWLVDLMARAQPAPLEAARSPARAQRGRG